MVATDPAMDENTMGTTMQNIKDFSECRRLENEVRAEPENAVGQL